MGADHAKAPSEKIQDKDMCKIELKGEDDGDGEKDEDEAPEEEDDKEKTPRKSKKRGRRSQGECQMQERTKQVIDAFSTMAKQHQESMVERLEKEEKMHQVDLAEQKAFRIAQEQSHDADRIAQASGPSTRDLLAVEAREDAVGDQTC